MRLSRIGAGRVKRNRRPEAVSAPAGIHSGVGGRLWFSALSSTQGQTHRSGMTFKIVQTDVGTHYSITGVKQESVLLHVDPASDVQEGEVTIAGDVAAYGQTVQVQPVDQAPEPRPSPAAAPRRSRARRAR